MTLKLPNCLILVMERGRFFLGVGHQESSSTGANFKMLVKVLNKQTVLTNSKNTQRTKIVLELVKLRIYKP